MATNPSVNRAAYLMEKQAPRLQVRDAPMPDLPSDYVMIRVHAVAINPVDTAMQQLGIIIEKYPAIIGCDVAGVIVQMGPDADKVREAYKDPTPLKVGDRVIAGTDSMTEPGAFQLYTSVRATQIAKLPDNVSFADGCVVPLCLATAASGLFAEDQLAWPLPQLNAKPTRQIVLIWGGASSVGTMAIQMAKAAGLEVVATASAANQEYLKSLGVSHSFDYRDPEVIDKIVQIMKSKTSLGAYDSVQDPESIITCGEIVLRAGGKAAVGTVLPTFLPFPDGVPKDVKCKNSFGVTKNADPWAVATWGTWATPALKRGLLKCLPEKLVVGSGLEYVQTALDRYREGVSARKVVVEIP